MHQNIICWSLCFTAFQHKCYEESESYWDKCQALNKWVDDSSVFVIAVCMSLSTTGQLPQSFAQEKMRSHMFKCLNNFFCFLNKIFFE